ncbi:MAG: HIT family protein [Deltaproteobacteria bacterium]|nr:HIT family protein [Deltaproteobacteria bacterium]MBW2081611.1 HIT family protein [Deltaproteobacteria bacterium]
MKECPFCNRLDAFLENEHWQAIYDKYPVTDGHALLISRVHIQNPFFLKPEEWYAFQSILPATLQYLFALDSSIKGFNIGLNMGVVAGQTVPHLHVHVIPRRPNDIPDSHCGIRMVNPKKAYYWRSN